MTSAPFSHGSEAKTCVIAQKTKYGAIKTGPGIVVDYFPAALDGARRPPSIRSIGSLHMGKTVGTGSTGKVKIAVDSASGLQYAVKIIYRGAYYHKKGKESVEAREERIVREAAMLNLLVHPNICRLYDVLICDDFFCLFLEYIEGGQMLEYILSNGKIPEAQSRQFFLQLLSAVDYCHRNSIVHRDLKIENALIDQQGNVKLIDFGLANFYNSNDHLKTFCGSLYFAAPELLRGNAYVGPEVDVWSLGIILFVLVCGHVPFDDQNLSVLHQKIKNCDLQVPDDISLECRNLIMQMIVADSKCRATLPQVMRHPWLKGRPVARYDARRGPIFRIREDIVQFVCSEFRLQPETVRLQLASAVQNREEGKTHEFVSLYQLALEKLQSQPLPQPKPAAREREKSTEVFDAKAVRTVYLSGLFSVHSIQYTQDPNELARIISTVLSSMRHLRYRLQRSSFDCVYANASPYESARSDSDGDSHGIVKFEVSIVRVAFFGGLGVQIRKKSGDGAAFKALCSSILSSIDE